MMMVVMVVVMMAEELCKLDTRMSLGGLRVVVDQGGNRVRHRLEQVAITCDSRAIQLLGRRSLRAGAAGNGKGGRRPE